MSSRNSFHRKIIYLAAIAVLLMPLFWLSQPATNAGKGMQGSPGGKLARLREDYHLSQAQLGQIDPTSETIKLATLGMRGVAANILWEKAIDFKMKKDWTNLGATLNQITKIQPNFVNVWINQAWNLAYNVSVEFDDYRERYRWVIKGINFLREGIKYNERQPRMQWELGWDISHKIGRADEHKQFRRLFAHDEDFRESLPPDMRDTCLDYKGGLDNWLVGKKWFERVVEMAEEGMSMMAQGMVEKKEYGMKGKSPLLYRSDAPMCQMYYAEALEKDGAFGEVAKRAWIGAADEWRRYGNEDILTSFINEKTKEPIVIHLNDEEMRMENANKLIAELDAIQPGLRKKIISEKRAALSAAQREALDMPEEKRTGKQIELAQQAAEAIRVTDDELAKKVPAAKRAAAKALAKEAAENLQMADYINRYREIVNFIYWRLRGTVEQTKEMLDARMLLHQGDRTYSEGDLMAARNAYDQGFKSWRKVLKKFPELVKDKTTGEDLMDAIKRYRRILHDLDTRFPKDFILQDVIDANETLPLPAAKDKGKAAEGGAEKGAH